MHTQGKFIVVEGLEGAGKTTAIQTIQSLLEPRLGEVVVTREPGGTDIGESVRRLIKAHQNDHPLDSRAELLLLYAARTQLVEQVIKPALAAGQWVVCDRFELSTYAYQGGGRQIDKGLIDELSNLSLHGFKPDLTLFMDIKPEAGLRRVNSRGESDRIEQESLDFFHAIYNAYHYLIKDRDDVIIINAEQPLSEVLQAVRFAINNYLEHHAD